ncbi:hypothetical protein SAMN02949497_4247 [Methylomagnum ishizawai]|uniref:Uncharacterized protein n=1 Tax=Methylomagnum ishizawai TaxID=1760988 RepID=A0A1Y6D9F1_9GAMM|nr:hypothetical protein [Methylomagnum ishizawai]SMF96834.1 hypothetical protein SAMN02949497_4247 [Methylomagnum ishizawai]
MGSPIDQLFPQETLAALRNAPMPPYKGREPSEIELKRIEKAMEQGRFDELPEDLLDWVCLRLMPSLFRYGCYPPPTKDVDTIIRESQAMLAMIDELEAAPDEAARRPIFDRIKAFCEATGREYPDESLFGKTIDDLAQEGF